MIRRTFELTFAALLFFGGAHLAHAQAPTPTPTSGGNAVPSLSASSPAQPVAGGYKTTVWWTAGAPNSTCTASNLKTGTTEESTTQWKGSRAESGQQDVTINAPTDFKISCTG